MSIKVNSIYNEDCFKTMERMKASKTFVDCVLTSPPYNMTKRKGGLSDSGRYDVYKDWKEESDYISWTIDLFNNFDAILKENRIIAYNFSYSIENPSLPYKLVASIESATNFMLIDTIIWEKNNGLPFPANKRRLSRKWEYVFIFARKKEINTYENNRYVVSTSKSTGQSYYNVAYNMIKAKNNDGKTSFNQATYSTEFCEKILDIYCKNGWLVYDPFIGTGTTAVACEKNMINYIGSEISEKQVEYSYKRIQNLGL